MKRKNRTAKIDCRMSTDLWHKVDGFAQAAHLSRSQVVERALLSFFGEIIPETPNLPINPERKMSK